MIYLSVWILKMIGGARVAREKRREEWKKKKHIQTQRVFVLVNRFTVEP